MRLWLLWGNLVAVAAAQEPELLKRDTPTWPPLAKAARVQGSVEIEFAMDADGRAASVRLVSGHSLLVPAAIQNVKSWVFRPAPNSPER